MSVLPDPCPLPEKMKKRSLSEKEKLIYAPMAGVGGIVYDKVHTVFSQISAHPPFVMIVWVVCMCVMYANRFTM